MRVEAMMSEPDALLAEIVAHLKEGRGLRGFATAYDVPFSTLDDWINADPVRRRAVDEARTLGAHCLVEESITLLDQVPLAPSGAVDGAHVQLLKARSEARRWLAERLLPRKYGNSLHLVTDVGFNMAALLERREQRLREFTAQAIEGVAVEVRDVPEQQPVHQPEQQPERRAIPIQKRFCD